MVIYLDVVPPVVAEVEPVTERVADLQPERTDGGFRHVCRRFVRAEIRGLCQTVSAGLRIHRSGASELELVQVLFFAIERVKDGFVQLLERLGAVVAGQNELHALR